jgi:hypothetical protein
VTVTINDVEPRAPPDGHYTLTEKGSRRVSGSETDTVGSASPSFALRQFGSKAPALPRCSRGRAVIQSLTGSESIREISPTSK